MTLEAKMRKGGGRDDGGTLINARTETTLKVVTNEKGEAVGEVLTIIC